MPATRLVIVEQQGRLAPRFRAAVRHQPAEVIEAKDASDIGKKLADAPKAFVVIEHAGDLAKTVSLLEYALPWDARCFVFLSTGTSSEAEMVLRTAGAIQLFDHIPPFDQLSAWVDRWVRSTSAISP
ncbi:hypothetical protein K2X85_03215 [bacterium]|nr:hypothetical protein [bacterium]